MKHVEYHPGQRLRGFSRRHFENNILGKIKRWNGEIGKDGYKETVKDHVFGLFTTIDELSNPSLYPHLSKSFDPNRAKNLAYFHDAGEIRAGDLFRSHPQYEELKPQWDALDHEYFRDVIATALPHATLGGKVLDFFYPSSRRYAAEITSWARESYFAAEDTSPKDKEALLIRILDRFQAIEVGFTHSYTSENDLIDNNSITKRTLQITAPHIHNLLLLLNSKAQEDFVRYLAQMGNIFDRHQGLELFMTELHNALDFSCEGGSDLNPLLAHLVKNRP